LTKLSNCSVFTKIRETWLGFISLQKQTRKTGTLIESIDSVENYYSNIKDKKRFF